MEPINAEVSLVKNDVNKKLSLIKSRCKSRSTDFLKMKVTYHCFLTPYLIKRGTRVSNRACSWGESFFEILVGEQKDGIQCFVVVQLG